MQNRPSATMRLIELAERLTPSGEIGDGMVQQFHEAAALARLEQHRERHPAIASAWRDCCHTRAPGAHDQECVGL